MTSLVDTIKSLCKQHGTTIPKLEKELGFTRGAIYKWDANDPGVTKVHKVAQHFGITVDHLLCGQKQVDPFTPETIIAIAEANGASIGDVIAVLKAVESKVLGAPLAKQ